MKRRKFWGTHHDSKTMEAPRDTDFTPDPDKDEVNRYHGKPHNIKSNGRD